MFFMSDFTVTFRELGKLKAITEKNIGKKEIEASENQTP